jgi:hypothetical protein
VFFDVFYKIRTQIQKVDYQGGSFLLFAFSWLFLLAPGQPKGGKQLAQARKIPPLVFDMEQSNSFTEGGEAARKRACNSNANGDWASRLAFLLAKGP